eukprot:jgi/Chlat1/1336/Chrsp118S01726
MSPRLSLVLLAVLLLACLGAEAEALSGSSKKRCKVPSRVYFNYDSLYPESFVWDPIHCRFITGSLVHANLVAVYPNGTAKELVADPEYANTRLPYPGVVTAGLQYDLKNRCVYACVHSFNSTFPYDTVAAYSLDDGRRLFTTDFSQSTRARIGSPPVGFLNDVVQDAAGNLYVTDTVIGDVWKADHRGRISQLATSPELRSGKLLLQATLPFFANGIDIHPCGDYLLVGSYSPGKLFKVDLANPCANATTRAVHEVTLRDGSPLVLLGIDGIAFRPDGSLVATLAQTEVVILRSNDKWRTARIIARERTDDVEKPFADASALVLVGPRKRVFVIYDSASAIFATGPVQSKWLIREVTSLPKPKKPLHCRIAQQ